MKNILIIVPHIGYGGQEKIAVETAAILKEEYQVKLVVFQRLQQEFECSVPIIDLNLPASKHIFIKLWRVLARNFKLYQLKKQENITVAYSFGDIANISNALSKVREKTFLSVHGHSSIPKSKISKKIYKLICKRAQITFCVSEFLTRQMQQATGLPSTCFKTLYNPYNIDTIKSFAKKNNENLAPTFVALGRLEKIKGYDNLLAAFALVLKHKPHAMLALIGQGSKIHHLQEQCHRLNIEKNVQFWGLQTPPYAALSKGDVFVLSSYSEGFPNAMIEAMACGLPVVAVDCFSGPREILQPCGDTVPPFIKTQYGVLCPPFFYEDTQIQQKQKQEYLAMGMLEVLENKQVYAFNVIDRASCFDIAKYKRQLLQMINDEG